MRDWFQKLLDWWSELRNSSKFRSLLTFTVFVGISALFWFILTLNDSVQTGVMVNLKISNKPDSITFITDVPKHVHVEVKDKGTSLMRTAWVNKPTINLDFRELAEDGQLVCSRSDITAALKEAFGGNATILSMGLDSLRLTYTDRPGKMVPVQVSVEAHAKAGFVVYGSPESDPRRVTAYGPREILDTLTRVFTKSYIENDLDQPVAFVSELKTIKGVRLIPSTVKVKVNVEPLVAKEDVIAVTSRNVPAGESLLLFPSTVRVSYYVPMSDFSNEDKPVRVIADYDELSRHMGERIPLSIEIVEGAKAVRPRLHADSVEYTLVR
ncbi:MAG: YbbR-like domain-containing protein [Muribaculum sp.]|nr:YbbR-like domain-containing protein [Muribaculum sp.]